MAAAGKSNVVGRVYGPVTYEVGYEKLREFAYAVGGTIPSASFSGIGPPASLHPWLHDREAGRASPHGDVVALPTFAVVYAMAVFAKAVVDPDLEIDLLRLVHGEQDFEFPEAVKPGDVISTTGTITKFFEKAGKDFLTVTSESLNQHGRVVARGVWTAVIRHAESKA